MSSRRFPSLAALAAALALSAAGCRGGDASDPVRAESMKKRLANQARAIAMLEAENEKLRAELKLERERAGKPAEGLKAPEEE